MRRLLASTLLCAGSLFAQTAPATNPHPYTMMYVFGDSYSDSGAGYVDADGPTAVVYLAQRLGIPFTYYGDPHSAGKGLNFAVSAASSGEGAGRRYPTGPMLGYGMANQVHDFISFSKSGMIPKIDPDNTMFFFEGGLNDYGKPDGFVRTNIEAEIDALYDLGARRFMVTLLPVKIPAFARAGLKANPQIMAIPAEEKGKHPDIRIATSDWGPFYDEAITHPDKYGLTNTTNACAKRSFAGDPVTVCPDPSTNFFYHESHPSTAAHKIVGDMLYREAITKAP